MTALRPPERLRINLTLDGPARPVGTLVRVGHVHAIELDPEFLAAPLDLSPGHIHLDPGLQYAPDRPYRGLHGLVHDSLPDGWGMLLMDRWFRQQGLSHADITPLARLRYLGDRTMGALTYAPADPLAPDEAPFDLARLAEQATELAAGREEVVLSALVRAGGSPGGLRPKILVGYAPATGELLSGAGDLPLTHEPWLIKLGAQGDPADTGPIEEAYARLARAAGLDVPATRLFATADGRRHFGVRRFDRALPAAPGANTWARRHVQSLAALLHADHRVVGSLGYEQLLRLTRQRTGDATAVSQVLRRMIFNVLASNRDDHARNHAFLLHPTHGWQLSPAYDLMPSDGPNGEHTLDVAGEGRHPTWRHLIEMARIAGIDQGDLVRIVEEVGFAVSTWDTVARELDVSAASRRDVSRRHDDVRAALGSRPPLNHPTRRPR